MAKHSITSINYHLVSGLNDRRRCVEVSFLFDGKPTKKLMYFQQKDGRNCITSAKQIIEKELNNGKLVRYAKKYHKKPIIVSKLAVTTTIVAIGAIAVGGFFTWRNLTPAPLINPRKGDVVDAGAEAVDKDGRKHNITVSNTAAIVGDPYKTDIILEDANATRVALPETLDKVTSNGIEVSKEEYTYEVVSATTAQLMIPGDNVKGKVDISLTLRDLVITVTMKVGSINGCHVSYKGNALVEGQTYIDFPTELVDFRISNIDFGYTITKDSFNIKDESGKTITPTYDETTHTVSFIALHNFTFSVSKILPEEAVFAHVTYPTDSVDISYGMSHKIENGELLPVVPHTSDHKEIGAFFITLNKDVVTSLIPLEITCSLSGSKVELTTPLGQDFDYSLVLNLEGCTRITDFTLDIHPGTYSPIDVSVTKGENCVGIFHDDTELSYEKPNAIIPIKEDNEMTVTFEIVTTGNVLKETDISCSLGYVPTISLIAGNTFQVKFTESSLDSFVLEANPGRLIKTAQVRIQTNNRCTITYRNLPVPGPQSYFTVVVIVVKDESGNESEFVFFDVNLKEGAEFNDDHVWIETDNGFVKRCYETSVIQDESNPNHYTVAVKMVEQGAHQWPDISYLEIMPGAPILTVSYDKIACPHVYYINENHEEQLVEPNTPYDYMPTITPDGNKAIQFHVEVAEGYYVSRVRSPEIRWTQFGDLILKPETTRTLIAICEEPGSELYMPANIAVYSERFGTIPDAHIEFNNTVKSVTWGDTTVTTSPSTIVDIDPVVPNIDFVVETDGLILNEDNVICEILGGYWVPEITIQPIAGASYVYRVSLMPPSHNISSWKMFYFTLKINPEEDVELNTIKGGDDDTYTLKYKYGEEEIEVSESGTPLIYHKGVYEYEFTVTPDESHRIVTDGYEAKITSGDQTSTLDLAVDATETGVIIKFETLISRSMLNHGDISSVEIIVHTDALTDATATFTFDNTQYSVFTSTGDPITSGETEIGITSLTATFYIKTEEKMNTEYIMLTDAPDVEIALNEYEDGDEYDYVLILSNITSTIDTFNVSIAIPAMLVLDDSTQGCFVDESKTPPEILEERISINYYIGQTEVDFCYYAWQGTTFNYEVSFISSTDPDITGFAEIPEAGTLWGDYFMFTIKFSKPITRSTVITIHVEVSS